jgi:phytoene synthase
VLRLFGRRDATLDAMSDDVCTALQLTNFWQDLAIDWHKGRLYVPLDDVRRAGADVDDLSRRQMTPAWREALATVAARTRDLFTTGRPIADAVTGRLRWELRATWLGGVRILDRLAASEFDVFHRRPRLGWTDAVAIAGRTVLW